MTDPVEPVRRPELRPGLRAEADAERRSGGERRRRREPVVDALVPIGPVESATPPPPEDSLAATSAYHAQLLGGAPRRGLKGGPETLDEARHTYLETEYSGPADRRPKKATAIDEAV